MKSKILDAIRQGKKPLGIFSVVGSELVIECIAQGGFDYVVIDLEHGALDNVDTVNLIRAAQGRGLAPFVRINTISRASVLHPLDAGAAGIIVPNVKSVGEARALVEWSKFAPIGQRGVGVVRATMFGHADYASNMSEYQRVSNEETLLLLQCETKECLESIDEIASINGVDGIFIGPFDLSFALGIPMQFDSPVFHDALKKVREACTRYKKHLFIFGGDVAKARGFRAMDFESVAVSVDASVFVRALKELVSDLKS